MPSTKSVSQIKSILLNPALTSHFEVEITLPSNKDRDLDRDFRNFLSDNGLVYDQGKLNLLCSEASLPGSSLTTHEITNDYHGVTERHAYRRVYDDRIDLTFYVDADNYLPIRFFENWLKWISNESIASKLGGPVGTKYPHYFYRMRYPKDYKTDGMKITKFERTGTEGAYSGSKLTYGFVGAYPISISSMPVSYDASSLLKCTVSMTYLRYFVYPTTKKEEENKDTRETPRSTVTPTTGDPSAPAATAATAATTPSAPAAVPIQVTSQR
jgi:hypothetical protein